MPTTQHREIRQRRRAAGGPVTDVVTLAERASAAREAAAVIAMLKRASQRGRNRAGARADFGDLAIGVVAHHHAGRIARQALRRSRGNVRAALEDGLAPSRRPAQARPPPAARWWALPENRPRTPVPRDRP